MWIDMFPMSELPPKPPIDITPQAPEGFELRVIIWNTENVPLVDNQFLTGEKCSDIYVKGYINIKFFRILKLFFNSFLFFFFVNSSNLKKL